MTFSIVTGANRGIGLALVAELQQRGHTVLAACRQSSPALVKLGVEIVERVDVATDAGVAALVAAVGTRSIDLLVNNAGIAVWGDRLGELNVEGIRKQFEVNALGPLRGGHAGAVEPAESARGLVARIDALTMETTGGFWHANGERLPW
jgi:NAD(P)-dependent dehydrogenase (short-subunit alcohol dehydrogenase family)